jgi:hypothetical protein
MKNIILKALRIILAILLVLTVTPGTVSAISRGDIDALVWGTPFYNPNQTTRCNVNTSTDLSGSDNAEKIWRFLIGKGLTPIQAAGLMGNIKTESSFNPRLVEAGTWGGQKWGGESDEIPPAVGPAGQPGYGLVQWTSPGRKKGLGDLANSKNPIVKPSDLGVQLEFMWSELEGPYKSVALDPLRQATTIEVATSIIQKKYEVGGGDAIRLKHAKEVLALYGGITTGDGSVITGSGNGCSDTTGPGQDTKYVDGFTVYSQTDPAWKDKPYSSSTIGASGCGPSAMAMIITALTGEKVTPVETSNYAAEQGMYVPGAGSSWTIGPVLAKHWGLKSRKINANVAEITAALQAGQLVVTPGKGPIPFTTGGHFIVIRAVTAGGKFKVGDSAHAAANEAEWDAEQIVSNMSGGGTYAIYK